jgi:Fe-S-cluster containining protein
VTRVATSAGKYCLACSQRQKTCCQGARVPMTVLEMSALAVGRHQVFADLFYAGEYPKDDVECFEPWWKASMLEKDGKFYRTNTRWVDGNCIFLKPGMGCTLHPRPHVCRIFPFWINASDEIIYEPGDPLCDFEREGVKPVDALALIGETPKSIRALFQLIKIDCEKNSVSHHSLTETLLKLEKA